MGVDLVRVERLKSLNPRFFTKIFTCAEQEFCERFGPIGRLERFAGRFAVKEAVSKALGTGISVRVNWKDIECLPGPDGRPVVILHRGALDRANELGADGVVVSLAHDRTHALAMALLHSASNV